jgi:two-component system cell cycle response regulator
MSMRVLIAEDDTVSRRVLQATLSKWGYEVVIAQDGQEAWEFLQRPESPNLAVLDWMMPRLDGLELCRRVRALPPHQHGYVYIILLTAKGRKEDRADGMEGGADDYLVKPLEPVELRARLRAATRILDLQGQLLAAQETLREKATHDPLTGLWNRSAVVETLEKELNRARRQKTAVSVLLADLDHFKQVNDSYGHDTGDQALCQTARRMLSAIRGYDTLGRYGGEEFLIVAPGCDAANGMTLAERIRCRIAAEPIVAEPGPLALTISVGVATGDGQDKDALPLIQAADQAMYRAKNAGRNRVELAAAVPLAPSS